MHPQGTGLLLLLILFSQTAAQTLAALGKRWEQISELQQGADCFWDAYCIQNLADSLFLWLYPVTVGFVSPFGEGEAMQPSSLGIMLRRLPQCTLAAPCSLPGASPNQSHPRSGLASHFTSCVFDLVP